jgi:hypothetical protein
MSELAQVDMLVRRICLALPRYAYRFANEIQLHERIVTVLEMESIPYAREYALGGDRFDFFCDGVVIEVKIAGSVNNALRQADRYCAHDEVKSVVVVSTRRWQGKRSPEPIELRGKLVHLVEIGGRAF